MKGPRNKGRKKRTSEASHPSTHLHSQMWSKKAKKRYTIAEKDKSSKAKDRWNNLGKADKKQDKLRPGTHN